MSNEKLAALLRECLADYSHPHFTDRGGMADRIRAALQAHAAEAAQRPSAEWFDQRLHERLLPRKTEAAQIQPQAAEPVAVIESAEDRHGPYLTHANVVLRVWNGYAPKAGDEIYTRPQPAQDAKVMFAPPQTEEDVLAYLQIARLHVKRFREILQDAIAKESGR